jgi:hypothetical protein
MTKLPPEGSLSYNDKHCYQIHRKQTLEGSKSVGASTTKVTCLLPRSLFTYLIILTPTPILL